MLKTAIFLFGPTASGKSNIAIQLADLLPVHLISVDSAMIYRGMDIGTAKPDQQTLKVYPHELVDILEPQQSYSVGQFCQDAHRCMEQAWQANKIPLLVGGTMLYFYCLQYGLSELPPQNSEIRLLLEQRLHEQGLASLYAELTQYDASTASRLHPHDTQRILRALEICLSTNNKLSMLQNHKYSKIHDWKILNFALVPERPQLHEAIAKRWQIMRQQGFVEEVERLYRLPGMYADLSSMRSLGYRQIWQYLAGQYDFITMEQKLLAATRQFAKRQCTWLNKWPGIVCLNAQDPVRDLLRRI